MTSRSSRFRAASKAVRAMAFSDFDHVGSFCQGYLSWLAEGLLMFRSSVSAFYPWLVCLFYNSAGSLHRVTFLRFPLLLRIRSEVEKIVHWMSEILFAAEIAFCGLDRCMSEQELNLLKLTATVVAQLRTSPAQVVWGNVLQARLLATASDHVPDHVLRDATAPHFPFRAPARKALPSVTFAARVQLSSAALTQSGMGTVRM